MNSEVLIAKKLKKYIDVTEKWKNNLKPFSFSISIDKNYIDDDGIIHPIEGKEYANIMKEESDEYKISNLIGNEIGGNIHLIPEITDLTNIKGNGKKTADISRNGIKWDLKTPKYKTNYSNLFNDIFKKSDLKLQSKNFIVNLINYPNITEDEILRITKRMFKNKYRNWIEGLIIVKDNHVYKIYIRE